jgi:hypothetical protein
MRKQLYLEAAPGFEPGIKVLQTHALPLGYAAINDYFKSYLAAKHFKCSINYVFCKLLSGQTNILQLFLAKVLIFTVK